MTEKILKELQKKKEIVYITTPFNAIIHTSHIPN